MAKVWHIHLAHKVECFVISIEENRLRRLTAFWHFVVHWKLYKHTQFRCLPINISRKSKSSTIVGEKRKEVWCDCSTPPHKSTLISQPAHFYRFSYFRVCQLFCRFLAIHPFIHPSIACLCSCSMSQASFCTPTVKCTWLWDEIHLFHYELVRLIPSTLIFISCFVACRWCAARWLFCCVFISILLLF